jgi:SPX domain protein involved in polyphosphate accumulation
METQQPNSKNYRYERKFIINGLDRQTVETMIKLHPALFSEIFHQRYVNNIYFDSINLTNYYDNIEGSTQRIKARIRWYGELLGYIDKPILEFKIKAGFTGKKESFALQPLKICKGLNAEAIFNIIEISDIPQVAKAKLYSLKPFLLNRYCRKYYQSVNKNYRITVDTDLVFYRIDSRRISILSKSSHDNSIILELKYDQSKDDEANHITAGFPFRLTKSSKYVTGIDIIYSH